MRLTNSTTALVLALAACTLAVPRARADHPNQGFIYATVRTTSGNEYRGTLRWGKEEAFWDDHFNSAKRDLPYADRAERDAGRRERIRVFGWTVGYRWEENVRGRQFIARFGDIAEIRDLRRAVADVVMMSGSSYRIEGGSNDVGAPITIKDEALGEIAIDWDNVESVVFAATPKRVDPGVRRLGGTVDTRVGSFSGWIQWDNEECLSSDRLDGRSQDGTVSIEMGRIRSIEKRGRRGSLVELSDGRSFSLSDSNDVNDQNRGIFVEDERFGRVKIGWDEFERVVFEDRRGSGRAYDDYRPEPLRGTVRGRDGGKLEGRIVFDLDESESWELLNGKRHGVAYEIPFVLVKTVEPRGDEAAEVLLRTGERLELEESQDVTDRNDGIVVLDAAGRERFIAWRDVARIDLD